MTFDSLQWPYASEGDRDCPGNTARLYGCRCINHRPDLWPSTVTTTGATLCTGQSVATAASVIPSQTVSAGWPVPRRVGGV